MVALTYGVSRACGTKTSGKSASEATTQKSFFARLMDAMIEARLRQAHREIMRHAHLLPYSLDDRGNRLVKVGAKDMPFRV